MEEEKLQYDEFLYFQRKGNRRTKLQSDYFFKPSFEKENGGEGKVSHEEWEGKRNKKEESTKTENSEDGKSFMLIKGKEMK